MTDEKTPSRKEAPKDTAVTVVPSFVTAVRDLIGEGSNFNFECEKDLESVLASVKDLLEGLAEDNIDRVESALRCIGEPVQSSLFGEVGKLTRRLHTSLLDFKTQLGPRLENMVENDVPQATDQLESVMKMTDNAAHKVLELVERQSDELGSQRKEIKERIEALEEIHGEEVAADFKALGEEVIKKNNVIQGLNTEILMAQEFQDLSGQILRKVIKLITEVEESLVTLVRMFGLPEEPAGGLDAKAGEPVPASEQDAASCDQDDIDGLLDSLGF